MYSKTTLILTSLMLVLGVTPANAQSSTDAAITQQELRVANEVVKTMRNMTIIVNLEFTPEENEKFWPLYEEYRQKVRSVRERKLAVVEAYAERYRAGTVDDDFADAAVRDLIQIQLDTAKIRQKFWKKFRRILPATKAARFYQIENKMDAEVDYALARGVPLVETN